MAEVIKMPRLSDTMEEGVVAQWLKKVGDKVSEGDILAEIETDKATMEFESFYDGTLLHIAIDEGVAANVDSLLCIIGEEGEDISSLISTDSNVIEETSNSQLDLVDQINKQEQINEEVISNKETEESALSDSENDIQNETLAISDDVHVEYIKMPRLSDTMEEGTISSWLKNVGDDISEGDILAEIETDKATMEFESFYSVTLLHVGLAVGDSAKVDSLLAVIGPKVTDVNPYLSGSKKTAEKPKTQEAVQEVIQTKSEKIIDDSSKTTIKTDRIFISPLAKKLAKEKNLDISMIQGTGYSGRIIKTDIENYKEPSIVQPVTNIVSDSNVIQDYTEVNHSQMRKVIAKRLSESKFSAPHYYLNIELDMSETIAFRKQCNSIPDTKISFNDIIIKACAVALRNNPSVNSQWFDDKIRYNNFVNIGVAVGVEDGLIVPVLKNADKMSVADISNSVKEMAGLARDKKLTPDMMQGSTFTISNLGMFGIKEFTSIINQPNSAILSVGSIIKKPVVIDDKITIGNTMKLTLACDHRTIDGVTGSLFLQTLKGYLENPVTILV